MKAIKIIISALALVASVATSYAQDLKFAHIDSQKFLSELPEWIAAQTKAQEEATKLEDQLKVMNNELQQKYTEYVSKRDSLPDLIRATKEKELQDSQQRIMSFQQRAEQSLRQKEQQLMQPIIEAYQKAIEEVGKENNFVYIFDTTSQVILYHSDASIDAAPLVKIKMANK